THFVNGSVVRWNGTDLTTQYVSSTLIKAAVPYASVQSPTTPSITVFNSTAGGGGGTSNPAAFTIVNAKPGDTVLTALSATTLTPDQVGSGSESIIGIEGTGFYPGSVATFNGSPRSTTFYAHNALTVALSATDL